jgi:hypothetical protein
MSEARRSVAIIGGGLTTRNRMVAMGILGRARRSNRSIGRINTIKTAPWG